jgi:membrane-bound lytic murein transglycosylase D
MIRSVFKAMPLVLLAHGYFWWAAPLWASNPPDVSLDRTALDRAGPDRIALENMLFPRPSGLEPDIAFWRRVYTEIDAQQGFIHDKRHLEVVYATVELPKGAGSRALNRSSAQIKSHYRSVLLSLAEGDKKGLTAEESRVLGLWPEGVSDRELRDAAGRLRMQQGLAGRFRAGLVRSGRWLEHIRLSLQSKDVPVALSALPHVESSFDPTVYSTVGAAGLWQFTRATGKQYMTIDHVVDDRRDPYLSSAAAASLLRFNHRVLGSWPLAITAYNHGVTGMRRAVKALDTRDIEQVVRRYNGKSFGFASRNFYVAFLAALDVERDVNRYFGPLERDRPTRELVVELPHYLAVDAVEDTFAISRSELRASNPALLDPVWSSAKYIPKGYLLRVPQAAGMEGSGAWLAAIPPRHRLAAQLPDVYHRVQRGDALSLIASRYGTSVAELMRWNNLSNRHNIRIGQRLRLPQN